MERTVPSFRWYRAFRAIMLVLAILTTLTAIFFVVAMTFFRTAALHESPPAEFLAVLDAIKILAYQSLVLLLITGLLFLFTFLALRMRRRAAIFLVYAQNVWLPLANLLIIPVTASYFRTFTDSMRQLAGAALHNEIAVFSVMLNTVAPISCVIGAMITAAVLLPNSIYFHKRREFIHLEDVSV